MLRSRAGTELLIEGVVRIVDWASYKNAGEGQLSTGNFLYFVLRELASTHPAEYTVCMVVRHRFSPFSVVDFLPQTHWGNPLVETETWINQAYRTRYSGSTRSSNLGCSEIPKRNEGWRARLGRAPCAGSQSAVSNQQSVLAKKMSPQISADKR